VLFGGGMKMFKMKKDGGKRDDEDLESIVSIL